MTETERKALALLNEVAVERGYNIAAAADRRTHYLLEAICRAIEQHEAFRQEVSDVAEACQTYTAASFIKGQLNRFIVPKPDPLVEALEAALWDVSNVKLTDTELSEISAAIAARGLKIVEDKA